MVHTPWFIENEYRYIMYDGAGMKWYMLGLGATKSRFIYPTEEHECKANIQLIYSGAYRSGCESQVR